MTVRVSQTQRRNTRQRQMILDEVRSRCDHPTANDVYEGVRARSPHVSRATVYRNLHLLVEQGEIKSVPTPTGEHFDLLCDDHAHAVCRACGAVADACIPHRADLDDEVSRETGWEIRSHETIFYGLCPDCRKR